MTLPMAGAVGWRHLWTGFALVVVHEIDDRVCALDEQHPPHDRHVRAPVRLGLRRLAGFDQRDQSLLRAMPRRRVVTESSVGLVLLMAVTARATISFSIWARMVKV